MFQGPRFGVSMNHPDFRPGLGQNGLGCVGWFGLSLCLLTQAAVDFSALPALVVAANGNLEKTRRRWTDEGVGREEVKTSSTTEFGCLKRGRPAPLLLLLLLLRLLLLLLLRLRLRLRLRLPLRLLLLLLLPARHHLSPSELSCCTR